MNCTVVCFHDLFQNRLSVPVAISSAETVFAWRVNLFVTEKHSALLARTRWAVVWLSFNEPRQEHTFAVNYVVVVFFVFFSFCFCFFFQMRN